MVHLKGASVHLHSKWGWNHLHRCIQSFHCWQWLCHWGKPRAWTIHDCKRLLKIKGFCQVTIIKSVEGGSPGQYLNIYSDQVTSTPMPWNHIWYISGRIPCLRTSWSWTTWLRAVMKTFPKNSPSYMLAIAAQLFFPRSVYNPVLVYSFCWGLSLELEFVPYQLSHCRY